MRVETIVPVAYADYYIGVILAIAQTFFGGFSFLFKKVGQNRTASDERKRVAKRLAAASSRASGASTISLRNDARGDDRTGSGSAAPAGDSGGATGGATEAGDNADAAREAGAANGQSSNNFRYLLDYVWWLGMLFSAPRTVRVTEHSVQSCKITKSKVYSYISEVFCKCTDTVY